METKQLSVEYEHIAPDCSEIRVLSRLAGGGMAHATLLPGRTSRAVAHKTVSEIWYFLSGEGEFWYKSGDTSEIIRVYPELSLTIPVGTHFQFRNTGDVPLCFVLVTMPPWPGKGEAFDVEGPWTPTCSENK